MKNKLVHRISSEVRSRRLPALRFSYDAPTDSNTISNLDLKFNRDNHVAVMEVRPGQDPAYVALYAAYRLLGHGGSEKIRAMVVPDIESAVYEGNAIMYHPEVTGRGMEPLSSRAMLEAGFPRRFLVQTQEGAYQPRTFRDETLRMAGALALQALSEIPAPHDISQ